ncbi:tripartite tricarboxylate transporter substrate binding protein [Succinatimonas hippei]|uniref:tripartite tricarboxylate transporter substrate binding protein n=1 Tax=Succinatimonas hippei TaxID=626938 RepID=UPI002011B881|nr:tripartite tricarboxylate transporter substrate binding protein [Succinatimonas hippei]MCL1602283.1 tripartite tricarboxylate transporter substrate binding protein [Succinatimonas hippei]
MKFKSNKLLLGAAVMAMCAVAPAFAADAAADYPNKTINMICTHGAGGDTDYNARLISRLLEKELGVSVVVNNVPGANGSIALTQYKDENPDGYTLIATNAMSLSSNEASGLSDYGYEAFEPVAVYGKQCGENLLVRADDPSNTLEELINASKEKPETIKLGIAMGGSSYVAALIMAQDKGAQFALVDAGGDGAERMTSLLGGHIDVTIAPYTLAKEYIESGKVKSICTLMSERLPAVPAIPTAKESGVPNLVIDTLYAILAPKGTDPAVVEKLNAAVLKIVNNSEEYKEAIKVYNFQEPYALNVQDSINRLKELREHMMSYAEYLQ